MKKLLAYAVAAFAFLLTSRVLAGPSAAAMASADDSSSPAATPSAAIVAPSFESLPAPAISQAKIDDLFVDADEITPTDPHPMIPLPPGLWAGFAGLALIARRVLRRRAMALA